MHSITVSRRLKRFKLVRDEVWENRLKSPKREDREYIFEKIKTEYQIAKQENRSLNDLLQDQLFIFIHGLSPREINETEYKIHLWSWKHFRNAKSIWYLSIEDLPDILEGIKEVFGDHEPNLSYTISFQSLLLRLVKEDVSNFGICFYSMMDLLKGINDSNSTLSCNGMTSRHPPPFLEDRIWNDVCKFFEYRDEIDQFDFMVAFLKSGIDKIYFPRYFNQGFYTLNHHSHSKHLSKLRELVKKFGWEDQLKEMEMELLLTPYFSRDRFLDICPPEYLDWLTTSYLDDIEGYHYYDHNASNTKLYPNLRQLVASIKDKVVDVTYDPRSGLTKQSAIEEKLYEAIASIYDEIISFNPRWIHLLRIPYGNI